MPIVDFETRVSSRFQCPTPVSAAPAQKRAHQMPATFDVKTPHVRLQAVLGTRGAFVDRLDCNFYQGHVPDSPVLLGPAQLETYKAAEAATSWGKKRLLATGAAALVGAGLGLLATGVVLGGFALAHLAWPAAVAAVTLADWLLVIVGWAVCGAIMCVCSDWRDWSDARTMFHNLRRMAECTVQLDAGVRRPQEDADSTYLVNFGRENSSWIQQQAALELEAARERAGMAACPQKQAA